MHRFLIKIYYTVLFIIDLYLAVIIIIIINRYFAKNYTFFVIIELARLIYSFRLLIDLKRSIIYINHIK